MDIASIIVSGIFGKSLDILFEHYPKVVSYVYANTHGLKMNIVKSFSFKSPYYVFVYGSSLDPENLKRTLEIDFDKIEYLPVILTGYRFEWGAPHVKMNLVVQHEDKLVSFNTDKEWVSIAIRETGNPADKVEGALISVSYEMLQQLIFREKNYKLKDNIRSFLSPVKNGSIPSNGSIITFVNEKAPLDVSSTYFLRKMYYVSILAARKKLGYSSFVTPLSNIKLYDVSYCDYELTKKWEKDGDTIDSKYSDKFVNYLYSCNAVRKVGGGPKPIPSSLRPYFLEKTTFERIVRLSELAVNSYSWIYNAITKDYKLFKQAGYSEIDWKIAKSDSYMNKEIPLITRVDLVFRGDRIKILEVNSDSPGGLFHYDVLLKRHLLYCADLGIDVDQSLTFNLCDSVCETLVDSWVKFCTKMNLEEKSISNIVILECDPHGQPTYTEFCYFKERIHYHFKEKYGKDVNVEIVAPEELEYRDGGIWYNRKKRIDLIYKRALWKELSVVDNSGLINAYLDNNVCVVNSLNSRNVGNKFLSALLHSDSFVKEHLVDQLSMFELDQLNEVKRYSPKTFYWSETGKYKITEDQQKKIFDEPHKYVYKSFHGHGSKEVTIGLNEINYSEILRELLLKRNYIAQEFAPHGLAKFPVVDGFSVPKWIQKHFILGAYIINGKCIAIEAKVGSIPITINSTGCYRTTVLPIM